MADDNTQATGSEPRYGRTPNGGAYSRMFVRPDGSGEVVEYYHGDIEIARTYFPPPSSAAKKSR